MVLSFISRLRFSNGNRHITRVLIRLSRPEFDPYVPRQTGFRFISSRPFSMAKRKRTEASVQKEAVPVPRGTSLHNEKRKPRSKRAVLTNPDINKEILDGQNALRASPSAAEKDETFKGPGTSNAKQEVKSENIKVENEIEAEDQEESLEEIQAALSRPPPVHSDYLPLPWKGRLGYASRCVLVRIISNGHRHASIHI